MTRRLFLLFLGLVIAASAVVYYLTTSRRTGLILTGVVTTDAVIVSSQIAGRLDQLRVKEGDHVSRHELLGLIEPDALKANQDFYKFSKQSSAAQVQGAVAALKYQELQTRDQIRQAEAALAATQAQVAEALANLRQARLDYERQNGLFEQGIVSANANDNARNTFQAQKARVNSLRKQVAAQRAVLALARSNAEQIAMRRSQLIAQRHQLLAAQAQLRGADVQLGHTEIRAPIAGLVATRAALQGEMVNPGQPIVTLVNPDDFWIRADVEETYIDRIRLGEEMPVRFPSGMERTGRVFFRGVDADYATQRDVSRTKRDIKTFEIRLRVNNSDRRIYPGETAYVIVPPKVE